MHSNAICSTSNHAGNAVVHMSYALIADIAVSSMTNRPRSLILNTFADHPRGYKDIVSRLQLTIPFAMMLMLMRLTLASVPATCGMVPECFYPYRILGLTMARGKCTRNQALLVLSA